MDSQRLNQVSATQAHSQISGTQIHSQNIKQSSSQNLQKIIQKIGSSISQLQTLSILQFIKSDQVDRLLGCMFGAFIGDSLGSFCQFTGREQAHNLIQKTMQMPGGGPFGVHPGQVTDDSEMALHLLKALLTYNQKTPLKQQTKQLLLNIGTQYIRWINSQPFDIGMTCRTSIGTLENHNIGTQKLKNKAHKLQQQGVKKIQVETVQKRFENLEKAWKQIDKINKGSLSNGFLMRLTPMACFYSLVSKYRPNDIADVKQLIIDENKMTHSNKITHQASLQYIQIIQKFVYRKSNAQILQIYKQYEKKYNDKQQKGSLAEMIHQGITDKKLMRATQHQGFFKIAFHYCFFFLKYITENCKTQKDFNQNLYKDILSKVISEGGDTDTNACIVGGFIGSILGFKNLPHSYLEKQLSLQLGSTDGYRGQSEKEYQPARGFQNLVRLILKFKLTK